jgi:hypothetical protein
MTRVTTGTSIIRRRYFQVPTEGRGAAAEEVYTLLETARNQYREDFGKDPFQDDWLVFKNGDGAIVGTFESTLDDGVYCTYPVLESRIDEKALIVALEKIIGKRLDLDFTTNELDLCLMSQDLITYLKHGKLPE